MSGWARCYPEGMPSLPELKDLWSKPIAKLPERLAIPTLASIAGGGSGGGKVRFDATIMPPGSKSLTNRALLMAALADGDSIIRRPLLDADDAQRMLEALKQLGIAWEITATDHKGAHTLVVHGCGGAITPRKDEPVLNLNNAGTATRFLTAACCLADRPIVIDGNSRMRQRPIGELVDMLIELGAEVEELGEEGCVPLRVSGGEGFVGGELPVGATLSSQYLSALLMVGPWLSEGLTLIFVEEPTSRSYVDMTVGLMGIAGAEVLRGEVEVEDEDGEVGVLEVLRVEPGGHGALEYEVEPDASGATYLWGVAALFEGCRVRVPGMRFNSLQADARFPFVLKQMGASMEYSGGSGDVRGGTLRGIEADLSQMPDAAMTLAVVACFAEGPTTIHGLKTLRVKETDRIAALQNELAKIGVSVEVIEQEDGDESIVVTPPVGGVDESDGAPAVEFETYDDHRMAMSLALIGLRRPNVTILDPACVGKTYSGYWGDLVGVYGMARR